MSNFSYDVYIDLVNNLEALVKRLKSVNKTNYTSSKVQITSHDIISLANSLQAYIRHYKNKN